MTATIAPLRSPRWAVWIAAGAMGLARPGLVPAQGNLPEKQQYDVVLRHSTATIDTFYGTFLSNVDGMLRIYLGDPDVPVPADIPWAVGLSVYRAEFRAGDWPPSLPHQIILDPNQLSIGYYDPLSRDILFDLYLTTEDGPLPVPMPLHMSGKLNGEYLWVQGDNGDVIDGALILELGAIRWDLYFSTEMSFTPGVPPYAFQTISDGDLVSEAGQLVATNFGLTANFGIMPPVHDIGLDAVYQVGLGSRFFSTEVDAFSEMLGQSLGHGDLLAQAGYIARINLQLVDAFLPMPPVPDLGLDAVHRLPNGTVLFSTEDVFFSESLGIYVSDGDLLSESGAIVLTGDQLISQFSPGGPGVELGLDAVYLLPPRVNTTANRSLWFSTEVPFLDYYLGPVSDGDLLSVDGSVVRRNLDLVAEFAPVEDVDNFGLDAVHVRRVIAGDLDSNNDVDLADFATFALCFGSSVKYGPVPGCTPVEFLASDLDQDGVVGLNDFATLALNFTG